MGATTSLIHALTSSTGGTISSPSRARGRRRMTRSAVTRRARLMQQRGGRGENRQDNRELKTGNELFVTGFPSRVCVHLFRALLVTPPTVLRAVGAPTLHAAPCHAHE